MQFLPSKENQKLVFTFIAGAFVGVFVSWMWVATQEALAPTTSMVDVEGEQALDDLDTPPENIFSGANIDNKAIVVPDQRPGTQVFIDTAILSEDGWVVIHEGTASEIGNALGAARFDAGEHSGVVDLLRATEPGTLYRAVLYRDNGDREFNLDEDFPFLQDGNQPVLSTFIVQ
ncbi:MAG: hypothetical protein OQJ98_02015 [Candidatus Pacebacteria bacterium]|nr:hypothetical protein [Candidatus Paceibacterota bacterium]